MRKITTNQKNYNKQVLPKIIWGGLVGEYTVPLRVLAVACTMRNKALRKCYIALWGITEHYGSTADRYGTLQSVAGHYGTLWKCCGNIKGCCRALQNTTEHYRMLRDVTKVTGALQSSYGMECFRTITENIDFAHHQLNFKFCSSVNVGTHALHYIVLSDSVPSPQQKKFVPSIIGDIKSQFPLKQCKMTFAYNSAYVQTETLNFTFAFLYFDAVKH